MGIASLNAILRRRCALLGVLGGWILPRAIDGNAGLAGIGGLMGSADCSMGIASLNAILRRRCVLLGVWGGWKLPVEVGGGPVSAGFTRPTLAAVVRSFIFACQPFM
jgi:hypothetical protein